MAVQTVTYGSETWTLIKSRGKKTESAKIKFCRDTMGYTLKDQLRKQ
jgi:hypothetical protein